MPETIQAAITVFFVGMISVFIILGLVVLCGQAIIHIVNYLHKPVLSTKPVAGSPIEDDPVGTISKKKLAAIAAAISETTKGRGSIEKIERLE